MTADSLDRDARLDQLLAEYLHAAEAGRPPDRQEFLARHPEFADELRSFLDNRAHIERLAAPLAGAALEATIGLGEGGGDGHRVRYFGEYELLAELGRGGMGVVYKARQSTLQRFVALKMILSGEAASPDDVLRFKQEAEAAATLDHPHIAPIYETGEHEGRRYFSMKLIAGGSLRDWLRARRNDLRGGVQLLAQVARAVHHAHQRGVLHRDLKPANVLLDEKGEPYVTDFGLAKRVEGGSDVTRTGAVLGTPAYMAPEQAMGEKQLTTAVDVYSLGAMMYELLVGVPPFQAASPMETLMQVISREPQAPRSRDRKIDRDLETICLKCLDKDPTRRYDSAAAFADELDRWLAGEPITARPVGGMERARRWCRRNPVVASLLALLVASLVGGAAVSTMYAVQAERQRDEAERAARLAKQHLYDARMNLAQVAWENLQAGRVRDLLKPYDDKPDAWLRGWEWHYQNRLGQGELRRLGHSNYRAAFSPDGTLAATWNWGQVFIYDFASGKQLRALGGTEFVADSMQSVTWHPDGGQVVVSNGSHTQFSGKPLVGEVKVLDATTGEVIRKYISESGVIFNAARFSPDGDFLIAGKTTGHDGRSAGAICIWDAKTGKLRQTFEHGDGIRDLALSPSGKIAVAVSWWKLTVWDLDAGEMVQEIRGDLQQGHNVTSHVFNSLAFSPDGSRLIAGCEKGMIFAWNVDAAGKLTPRTAPPAQTASVNCVTFSPDGKLIAGAGADQTVRLWDAESGEQKHVIRGHNSAVMSAVFSRDGSRIVTGEFNDWMKVWGVDEEEDCRKLRGHAGWIRALAFSPDGTILASGTGLSDAGRLTKKSSFEYDSEKLWDVASERLLETVPGRSMVQDLEFTSDGKRLLSAGFQTIDTWELASRQNAAALKIADQKIAAVAVSPDGAIIASGTDHGEVKLWNAADGKELHTLRGQGYMVYCLAFHPNGKTLAAGISDLTVRLYDVASGGEEKSIPAQGTCVAYSPDGTRLAVIDTLRKIIHVMDAAGEKKLLSLQGHTNDVHSIAFSPNGRRLASGGADEVVKVWDLATAQEVRTLTGHVGPVNAVAFSPDGQLLASGGNDKIIRLWDARPLTPESATEREALAVLRTLRRQTKSEAQALAAFRESRTISDSVKARGAELFAEAAFDDPLGKTKLEVEERTQTR